MTLRVGINGFGRIGRNVLRAIVESQREDIKVVAINNRSSIQVCAHLLKYDSVHGRFPFDVNATENILTVDNNDIHISNELSIGSSQTHITSIKLTFAPDNKCFVLSILSNNFSI